MLDLAAARQELLSKSLLDIERATAITWAGRAAACLDLAHEAETRQGRSVRLRESENYRQEALEHAAMTEDIPFLQSIIAEIDAHKTRSEQRPVVPARGARPVRERLGGRTGGQPPLRKRLASVEGPFRGRPGAADRAGPHGTSQPPERRPPAADSR